MDNRKSEIYMETSMVELGQMEMMETEGGRSSRDYIIETVMNFFDNLFNGGNKNK